ncbi:aldo/keto reductase [Olivibacter sp. CPCC 100613]|uniref:aldo/keto reductase n=1 Tax=Olivibacter sp. CPCC 100613 TaxID=3079931 RepID=UPI002FFC9D57
MGKRESEIKTNKWIFQLKLYWQMIELNELSKVGFGGYRISSTSKENFDALNAAIQSGCNLIDTASNYTDGESEKLVGEIFNSFPREKIFVITKAGYISGKNLAHFKSLNKKGAALNDVVKISESFEHSIHPDYLKIQIEISLKRLNTSFLDGFLLHSPEYFFDDQFQKEPHEEYYRRIKKAFEFLEEMVEIGKIRCYGVSSNTFTIDSSSKKATDLRKVIAISNLVRANSNFKLIQLPYNLIENKPSSYYVDNQNLINVAKTSDLTIISNRPLNAMTDSGLLRLGSYRVLEKGYDTENDDAYSDFVKSIEGTITEKYGDITLEEIEILSYTKRNWKSIDNLDVFNAVFDGILWQFLTTIFDEEIPKQTSHLFTKLKSSAWDHYLQTVSSQITPYLESQGISLPKSNESLPQILMRRYLDNGIDHVLCGITKPKYVQDYVGFF